MRTMVPRPPGSFGRWPPALAGLGLLGLLLGGACAPSGESGAPAAPHGAEPHTISLLGLAPEAQTRPAGIDGPEPRFDVDRKLLALPNGSSVSFYLRLAAGARLEARQRETEGTVFIDLEQGNRTPRTWPSSPGARDFSIELTEEATYARLTFAAVGGDAALLAPRIETPAEEPGTSSLEKGGTSSWRAQAGRKQPNVVLYLVDTLRADHLGVYGSEAGLTPRLDAFAEEAVVVERATAASPWTRPSVASIFTGRWPLAHGVNTMESALPEEIPTLAEQLKEAGYSTAGFTSNRQVGAVFGFGRGFDVYEEVQGDDHYLADSSAAVHQAAVDWLESGPKEPFFLYLHTIDPHAPYAPAEPWRSRYAAHVEEPVLQPEEKRQLLRLKKRLQGKSPTAEHWEPVIGSVPWIMGLERGWLAPSETRTAHMEALYDAEVASNDARFGQLLDELQGRGLLDRSLVVFTTDHGEEFAEHGQWQHGKTFYDEVLRAALLLRLPKGWEAPHHVPAAGHPDLTATILAATVPQVPDTSAQEATIPQDPDTSSLEGRNLLEPPSEPTPVFSWLDLDGRRGASVVQGSHKLILWEAPEISQELYDLAADPNETNNIAVQEPLITAYLTSLIRGHRHRHPAPAGSREVEIDEETRRRLEALGYV